MTKSRIKKNMEVIGADGVHIGTVDRIIAGRIRLTKNDSGEGRHKGHHHYVDLGLVADIEGQTVRLSAIAATAVTFEEEKSGGGQPSVLIPKFVSLHGTLVYELRNRKDTNKSMILVWLLVQKSA